MRAFLAIPVQAPALDAFLRERGRLVADVRAVRWAPATSPHITLHFFGTIGTQGAGRALTVLRPVLAAHAAPALRLRGLGWFPSAGQPRVLWWGVDNEDGRLISCALACRETLQSAGFAVEEHPYRAHCTLGRPRQPWPAAARESWRRRAREEPRTPSFTADHAVLYESLTGAEGLSHVPREVLPLGAA